MDTLVVIVGFAVAAALSVIFWVRLLHNDARPKRKPRIVDLDEKDPGQAS